MANLEDHGGMEALHRLKSTDPPQFLSPSPALCLSSRIASRYLFATLKPYSPKSPFDQLLTDGFDAEQIWQQIDLQSQPLIFTLKREIKRFERDPDRILGGFGGVEGNGGVKENGEVGLEGESEDFEGLEDEEDENLEEGFDEGEERESEEGESEERESEEEEKEEEEEGGGEGVEDKFLKIDELGRYLEEEEKREFDLGGNEEKKNNKKVKRSRNYEDDAEEEEEEEEEEEDDEDEAEDDDELGLFEDDVDDGGSDMLENARYEDFFVSKKNKSKRESKRSHELNDEELDEEELDDEESDDDESDDEGNVGGKDDNTFDKKKKGNLSTYEMELENRRAEIEKMEKANLEPKTWTMQGEVTASKRPKDSALQVDLDFEHNVRPPPVITEEVTACLEDIIKKRILEEHFDDVQKAPKLPSEAPRERKELDDNKSKKGLAEIYAEEYAQKAGLASAPVSFSDELKKEASALFKRLCLKLDALSHFHFAPKPVVEDMSIQANVPALVMEEVAPVAVSDVAMIAPEEVFAGKGDIKEEAELTQAERKQRRAKKKRKFKAEQEKRAAAKKARENTLPSDRDNGKEL